MICHKFILRLSFKTIGGDSHYEGSLYFLYFSINGNNWELNPKCIIGS